MFAQLTPLITERNVHLLISAAKDGKISVYIEPCKKDDKEDVAFVTPFRVVATPEELDAQFPAILGQWVTSRQAANTSLSEALAIAEAAQKTAAEAAKKTLADKNKKTTPTTPTTGKTPPKAQAKPVIPSLLDNITAVAPPVSEANPVDSSALAPEAVVPAVEAATQAVSVQEATVTEAAPLVTPSVIEEPPAPTVVVSSIFTETAIPELF